MRSWQEQANPCCVWGLSSLSLFEPLVIFNDSRLLHILNVRQRKIVSTLAGHGGVCLCILLIRSWKHLTRGAQLITSITVHPIYPYIFCTTSRDFTTRIYDLTLPPRQTPNNPHWPPGTRPSRGGAPAGMHSSEPEGYTNGVGRCVAILAGGRSGGHQAAVLNSVGSPVFFMFLSNFIQQAFHPTLPLLATCGVSC
jgi:polycomb protein EED